MAVKWGILSTADINKKLLAGAAESDDVDVVAVGSRDLARAEQFAETWDIPRAYGTYEELLADPDVQAVYIPLPNTMHTEWSIKAMEAGKHVLCEKPLALTVADVDRVQAAATRASRVAAEAFMYRHHPLTAAAAAIVSSGRLGKVHGYKGAFTFPLTREGDVRLDPALGGGSLWDVGCYPVSYTNLLAGTAPVEVFGWQQSSASGVDLQFAGMMRFADGSVAQFDSGFNGPLRTEMEIIGRDATLRVERPFRADDLSRLLLTTGDVTETLPFDAESPFAGEIADMESAALDSRPPRIPLSESRRTVQTITALYESARGGTPVGV
jgi:predicted dehydrogenase